MLYVIVYHNKKMTKKKVSKKFQKFQKVSNPTLFYLIELDVIKIKVSNRLYGLG